METDTARIYNAPLIEIAFIGAKNGIILTFIYGFSFGIYAVARSTLFIVSSLEPNMANETVFLNAFALIIPVVIITLILAPASAILGMIISSSIYLVTNYLNVLHSYVKILLSGFVITVLLLALFHLFLSLVLGQRLSAQYWDTYMFWFILPAILVALDSFFISRNIYQVARKK